MKMQQEEKLPRTKKKKKSQTAEKTDREQSEILPMFTQQQSCVVPTTSTPLNRS